MNGDGYSRDARHGQGSSRHYSRDDRRDRDRRRRSRSPHRSRRDYEVDTYSSSRDYREREREDTYARRERRDDRAWDRDSHRREPRRDDDRGYNRRDREFDDRRGRRDRDRDGYGGRDRKKSASPPAKVKREPTPDLTGAISIQTRQRRMTQWDIKPGGYENITAEQAKLSGMFPLPGGPRAAPMDPSRLQAFMNQPAGSASASALKPANAKQAKRLLVYNLPPSATPDSLTDFFNLQLNGLNVVSGADPCLSAQFAQDGHYALMEFKTSEDATMALALDGISMEDTDMTNGQVDRSGLLIRRPKDYIVPTNADDTEYVEGEVLSVVNDSPNKISISNIPVYLDGEQMQELLVSFGALKAFILVKDDNEQSRGIAFCEYSKDQSTAIAIEGLNGMELGDGNLKVQRASIGTTQAAGLESGVNAMTMLAGSTSNDTSEKSRVIQLMNMVTPEELMDRDAYQEIYEDIEEECSKFGNIIEIKMPRPSGPRINSGVGKIYIKYSDAESAQKAITALAGRKFSDRTVLVAFFSEELFDVNAW